MPASQTSLPEGFGTWLCTGGGGLHMTNASQQERGRNAEKPAAVLRTERAPELVPIKGNGVC